MRATMFAFLVVAMSMHLYARQTAQSSEQIFTANRLAVVAGSPVVIR
ncbi:hypothetical protein ACE7GA_16090 [Roseomonas sp. CCTCC AB2023176]